MEDFSRNNDSKVINYKEVNILRRTHFMKYKRRKHWRKNRILKNLTAWHERLNKKTLRENGNEKEFHYKRQNTT